MIISRDRLIEMVAELVAEAAEADQLSTEEEAWGAASEIVDSVLAELRIEEGEDDAD